MNSSRPGITCERLLGHLVAVMLCFFGWISHSAAAPTPLQAATTEVQKKQYTIAVGRNSYPYQFAVDGGKADGLLVDIWNLWARRNGYVLEFKLGSWFETLKMIDSGEVDFHAGMAITEKRSKAYLLGHPIVPVEAAIFVHQQLGGVSRLEDLTPYVVGVVAGSGHVSQLHRLVPRLQLRLFDDRHQMLQAAADGELKAFAAMGRGMSGDAQFARLDKLFPLYKKISYQVFDMSYAVKTGNRTMAQILDKGLERVTEDDIRALERKWLGLGVQSGALVIATQVDMAPFMSVSNDGEPIGLLVDIWKKWSEKTGQKIEFLADNQTLSLQNLAVKKADIHAGYADSSLPADLYPQAYHIYSYDAVVFYPSEVDNPLTSITVGKASLGVLYGEPVVEEIHKRFPHATIARFSDIESMAQAALSGRIDGFVAGLELGNLYLLKNNLHAKFANLDNIRFETRLHSLVRKDNKALISQIKEGFELISVDELRRIEKNWIRTPESRYFANVKKQVRLTTAEKSWLLRHPIVRLGALNNWPPNEFVDENGAFVGVTADLKNIIEQRAQVTLEVHLFDEWSKLLAALRGGDIDLVASMEKTPDRADFAVFTEGYWPQPWGIIRPTGGEDVHSLEQLSGKRLAIVKGYQLIPKINQRFPNILLQIVPDAASGFEAVRRGQADAYIDGMVSLATELREGGYRDLQFSLVDDLPPSMDRFGVRKDYEPLAGILNKVILTISDEEKKKILEHWFEIKIESGIETEKVLQFGALALAILLFVLIWNRRLRSEINLRRAIEQKMKHMATHDELTQLPNRTLLRDRLNSAIAQHARHHEMLALLFIDLDGFKDVNDRFGHDVGDELLVQLAERFNVGIRRSDTVARFGGDEFVVLLTSLNRRQEAVEVCQKLLDIIKRPFSLSKGQVEIGACIGVAMYPDDGTGDTELMKVADTLMYKVKASGKDGYLFYG